jgi:hypothetical protein
MMKAVHEQDQERRKPALIAYSVKLNEDENAIWTRIGAAWAHKKGPGFSIQLDALPLEGRIVLVAPAVDPKQAASDA